MKLRSFKFTVFRRLPWSTGGDFAEIWLRAYDHIQAARMMAELLASMPVDNYDWHYSPTMFLYDAELEYAAPTKN